MGDREIIASAPEIATAFSAFVAMGAFLFSLIKRSQNKKFKRKEHTFEIIAQLQKEVFNELNFYKGKECKFIAENFRKSNVECNNGKSCEENYKILMSLLSQIDHFSYGVENDFYDFETVKDLCGGYLQCLYKKFLPVIERARKNQSGTKSFANFKELVIHLSNKEDTK